MTVIILIVDPFVIIAIAILIIAHEFFSLTINVLIKALIIEFNSLAILLNYLFELQISLKTGICRCILHLYILLETILVIPLSILAFVPS